MQEYIKTFQVIWADLDPNNHMRHTAYNDYAAQVRLSFFLDNGFSVQHMSRLQIGPILFKEETTFLREVGMNEIITVNCLNAGMRKDGSRWKIVHEIYKADHVKAAIIKVEGAWMDLKMRKLAIPPEELLHVVEKMPKTQDFEILPEKSKG
jgi:acyl-CoA thioester hydrolase